MWICLNHGFISIVHDKHEPRNFLVRSRKRQVLETLFPNTTILTNAGTDYKYRVSVLKPIAMTAVVKEMQKIDYTNFKDSVVDKDLHDDYSEFWFTHFQTNTRP